MTTTIEKRRNHPAKTTLTANVHCTSFALAASSETRAARGMGASAWNRPERSSAALTGAKGEADDILRISEKEREKKVIVFRAEIAIVRGVPTGPTFAPALRF